jgi:arginine N-succinyltransferase
MAEFGDWFETAVIAEMRGVVDGTGHAPFWEALGRHFFGIDFPLADYLSMKDKRFIGELMPPHPIYIDLLPREVQGIIGEVHPETRPALEMLQAEGFGPSGMVDIFDGGPIVRAARAEIRTVRESGKKTVAEVAEEEGREDSPAEHILSNARIEFRACLGTLEELPGGGVRIPQKTARALEVGPGDAVRCAPLRPGSK